MADPLNVTVDVREDGFSVTARGGSWLDAARMVTAVVKAIRPGFAEPGVEDDPQLRQLDKHFEELIELLRRSASAGATLTTIRPASGSGAAAE